MKRWILGAAALAALGGGDRLLAQPAPTTSNYVTREEYDKLQSKMDAVLRELADLKKDRQPATPANPPVAPNPPAKPATPAAGAGQTASSDVDKDLDDIHKELKTHRSLIDDLRLGTTKIVLAGDAALNFTAQRHSPSTFEAGFAPLFLWQINDRLLFEGALDIGISTDDTGSSSTSVDLTIANISYVVNDYIIVGGGLFVVPFAQYHNSFDPPWINKFPDDPLAFGDSAIAPSSEVGLYIRGGCPIGTTRINYAVYAVNGPQLNTTDPGAAGSLNFDDFTDFNGNKAVGGRIGFLPIPQFEIGLSAMYGQVSPDGFSKRINALLWAIDANYRRDVDAICGTIDLRAEWVWSHVDRATYDPTHSIGFGPLRYGNDRNGGYVQVAYRPTKIKAAVVKDLELALRYDAVRSPASAPGGDTEQRWTIGLDYWLAPNIVFKIAYEIDHKKLGEDANAFLFQFGIGL